MARIGNRNYEFERQFMASEADRLRKKAKWHTDRAGTGMPAKFEKAAPMLYKAELADSGDRTYRDVRGKERKLDNKGWPEGTERWAFR